MRSAILGCSLLVSSILWGADAVKEFVQDLTRAQKNLMSEFLLTVVEDSGGYVIFGDKPMSIKTYDLSSLHDLTSPNAKTLSVVKGKELWEDLNIGVNDKEYLLSVYEEGTNCHILAINRKAFINTVKENITLFKYVLGPAVTPEGLLKEVIDSKQHFCKALKNDQTLQDILLGCGKQNAVINSRMTVITDVNSFGPNEEFPLISKKMSRSWASSSKKFSKQPSFGFSSINEEEAALNKLTVDSGKLKAFSSYEIPNFKCEPTSEETAALLSTYEQNRNKILKAVAHKNFLENTLRKLFTTTSQVVELPSIPKQRDLCLPENKEETVSKMVEIIQKKISMEPFATRKFQVAFMQGVVAREKGKEMPVPFQAKRCNHINQILSEIACCQNLEKANAYFNRLSQRSDLVALVPNELYYKVLKSGKDNQASHKTCKVSFQYSFQILGDQNSKDWGMVKQEDLGALIPGIAYSIIGMQRGEERLVYIHPKYAYGEDTFYPPNLSIVAQIRLLDFEESEEAVAVCPAHQLEERDYKDLLAKFEVLRAEEYFDAGVEFWNSNKKSGDFFDFKTFQKLYDTNHERESSFMNVNQEDRFIVDLGYHLISLQKKS